MKLTYMITFATDRFIMRCVRVGRHSVGEPDDVGHAFTEANAYKMHRFLKETI